MTSSWVAADADAPGLRSKASEGLGISWRLCLPELLCFGWLASLVLLCIEGPAGRCITTGVSRYWNGWLGDVEYPLSRFGIWRFPPWGDCCRSLPSLPCAAGSCRSMLSSPLSAQRSMLDSTAPTFRCAARPRVACSAPGPCWPSRPCRRRALPPTAGLAAAAWAPRQAYRYHRSGSRLLTFDATRDSLPRATGP